MRAVAPLLAIAAVTGLMAPAGCAPHLRRARLGYQDPVTVREHEAAARHLAGTPCNPAWGFLIPGMSQICQGRDREGGTILALAAVEAGTALVVGRREGFDHPGAAVPLLALQDLWVFGVFDGIRDQNLAGLQPYTPQDTFEELAVAPFNWRVLKRPEIWLGILATTGIGVAVSMLVDESSSTDHFGDDPNIFGTSMEPALGYPIATGVGLALFEHVALAEEMMFRGVVQSAVVRRYGETTGWVLGSLLFGLAHAPNALLLPEDQRRDYLLYGVPFITVIGSYLGLVYRWDDYSLAPPIAVHFWYDFLLTATFFALDPTNSPISASITIPF